jgi:hypothetical protein
MNRVFFGLFCAVLAVASAQGECMKDIELSIPILEKIYFDVAAKNWVALEVDIERLIPIAKIIFADCANYKIPDSPRVQACITNTEIIARLAMPLIVNPEDEEALYNLLLELPGYLTTLYTQCINPHEIKSVDDYVTVLLQEKEMEGNIFNCISNVVALFPNLKKLVGDVKAHSNIEIIEADLTQIMVQLDTVCDACGIPKPGHFVKPVDMQQCIADVDNMYGIVVEILKAKFNVSKMIQGIRELAQKLPITLADCGVQI